MGKSQSDYALEKAKEILDELRARAPASATAPKSSATTSTGC